MNRGERETSGRPPAKVIITFPVAPEVRWPLWDLPLCDYSGLSFLNKQALQHPSPFFLVSSWELYSWGIHIFSIWSLHLGDTNAPLWLFQVSWGSGLRWLAQLNPLAIGSSLGVGFTLHKSLSKHMLWESGFKKCFAPLMRSPLSLLDVAKEAFNCGSCWELFATLYEADHTEKDEKNMMNPGP